MPALDLIKQGEQGQRDAGGRILRGRSGNPGGRQTDAVDRRRGS
jgi:hypothetical protein